jgi:hypothetical protein
MTTPSDLWLPPDAATLGVSGDTGHTPEAVFVREYVEHGDAMLATNRAGLQDSRYRLHVTAERILGRPEIQDAIRAERVLQSQQPRRRVEYTRELLMDDMQRISEAAYGEGNYPAAISAKKLQAQLAGMLEQTLNVTHRMAVNELSDEQLMKIVTGRDVTPASIIESSLPPASGIRRIPVANPVTIDATPVSAPAPAPSAAPQPPSGITIRRVSGNG